MRTTTALPLVAGLLGVISTPLVAQNSPQTGANPAAAQNQTAGNPPLTVANPRSDPASKVTTVVVLLPVQQAGDQLGGGCWVRFYDEPGYRGANLTLVGPVDMPKMEVPGSLWRDWDSVVVGPRATVTTFDNENFRDRTARLNSGAHVADLHASKLGWFDEVHSAKVNCG
jgi:hypothetical protein